MRRGLRALAAMLLLLLALVVPARVAAASPVTTPTPLPLAQPFQVLKLDETTQVDLQPGRVAIASRGEAKVIAYHDIDVSSPSGLVEFTAKALVQRAEISASVPLRDRAANLDGRGLCLSVLQLDAAGLTLSEVASRSLPASPQPRQARVVATLQPGVAKLRLQVRAIEVDVQATVGEFAARLLPFPAPLPGSDARMEISPQGRPLITVNGELLPPAIFHANHFHGSDQPEGTDALEFNLAQDAGVRVLSVNLRNIAMMSNSVLEQSLEEQLSALRPGNFFIARIWMGPASEWLRGREAEAIAYPDGTRGPVASVASQAWLDNAAFNLEATIRAVRASRLGPQFIGVVPMYHKTGEWMLWDAERDPDYSPVMEQVFRAWALREHGGLAGLNAAWGTSLSSGADIKAPTGDARRAASVGPFRRGPAQQASIDFERFMSLRNVESIRHLLAAADRGFDGRGILGIFYGYHLEMAWNEHWPHSLGHTALAELLQDERLDFVTHSYAYSMDSRSPGLPVDAHGPIDSHALHGKAYFVEEDMYTHTSAPPEEGVVAPGYPQRSHDTAETVAALQRTLGFCIARGYGIHWQNLLSDGRFSSPEAWAMYRENLPLLLEGSAQSPQVAFIIDEQAFHRTAIGSRSVFGPFVYELRAAFSRLDVTTGYYLLTDIDRIPESVRLLVFINPYNLRGHAATIAARFARDGRILVFAHAPNASAPHSSGGAGVVLQALDGGTRFVLREGEALHTGAIVANPGLPASLAGLPFGLGPDRVYLHWAPEARHAPLSPAMVVEDPRAIPLGVHSDGKSVAISATPHDGWTEVLLGGHVLEPEFWRALARNAGAHLYTPDETLSWDQPLFLQASDGFTMLQSPSGGPRRVVLPSGQELTVDLPPGAPVYLHGAP